MNAGRLTSVIAATLCTLVGVLVFASAPALASKGVVGYFGGTGTTGGLFSAPGGVAVNDTTGNVYVVDRGNNRVQELSSGGAFVRAWGLGVVSTGQDSGGTFTVQSVKVSATSGTFTLTLSGQTTGAIAFDAADSVVEADLDALSTVGGVGGSVTVTGGPGSAAGGSPYVVSFGGSMRGAAVALMTINGSGLGIPAGTQLSCTAGPGNAATKDFQWLRNGVAIAGASSSSYTTVAEDAGDVIQCQVFALNANAGATQVSATATVISPAPATAPPVAPSSIAEPAIATGALEVGGAGGATLSCAPGVWTGASTFAYQWYRNGVALSGNGAGTSVYTVQGADLVSAAVFQCEVTASDAGGSVTLVSSNRPTAPAPSGPLAPVASATVPVPAPSTVTTTATGAPAFEVCNAASLPADVCKGGLAGEAAGAMSAPQGIAVEQVTGDVYVTDQGNHRVDEFTEVGGFVRAFGVNVGGTGVDVCTSTCKAGSSGAAAGEFGASIGYPAVDPVTGDVYVADPANSRVDVFEGDGVFVHAFGWGVASGAGEFQLCTSTCRAGVVSSSEINLGRFAAGSPTSVALDGLGDVYVVDGGAPDYRVQKFAAISMGNAPLVEFFATAQLTGNSSATAPSDVAVEPTLGSVLVAREPAAPAEDLVYELGSGGALHETYGEGAKLPAANGLAAGSSAANAYLSTVTNNRVFVLGTILAPTVAVEAVSGSTSSEATLHGTVNPNETPPNALQTAWQFEYSTNDSEWTPLPAGELAASTSPVAVTQTITGLEGHTLYYVRLRAEKEFAGGNATSTSVLFTTSAAAPSVSDEAVSNVATTSATLSAQINPQHLDTTYHFEYDTTPYTTTATHGTSLPIPDQNIGEGTSNVAVSQESQSLRPGTTYYYRVTAANSVEATDGPGGTFVTPSAGAFALPDGRAWELVSPPDQHGTEILPIGVEDPLVQAAEDGDGITYGALTPIVSDPVGNLLGNTRVLSTRGTGGWSSQDIETPNEADISYEPSSRAFEYRLFSADLSLAIVEPNGITPPSLAPGASGPTIYLRDNTNGAYTALASKKPIGAEVVGATPDLSHVVIDGLEAGMDLDPAYPGAGGLYEWTAGRVQLVSVLPGGEAGSSGSAPELGGGYQTTGARHAISSDGSRVVWSYGLPGERHLYMRDMAAGKTIQLDAVQGGSGEGPVEPVFQTASESGSRVFFTDTQRLTPDANAKERAPDLYDCEVVETAGGLACELTDLTADTDAGESADVQDAVPGASEDGSYVYFVAEGVLGNAENSRREMAVAGQDNLYVRHDNGREWEAPAFIAALSSEDSPDWDNPSWEVGGLRDLTARVAPDGRYLAFMSEESLTGYDNVDVSEQETETKGVKTTVHHDEEVYEYHAPATPGTESGALICASCNPSGARPAGVFDTNNGLLVDPRDSPTWAKRWLAGSVPGWTPVSDRRAFYQSRYLSDSGRLFFDSADALVPQDANGKEDVYEYEPPGIGGCTQAALTFSERSGGCVGLISAGTSSAESAFLDASASGDDVFFLTASQLVPQAVETGFAVYDAHVCGAEGVACTAAPVVSPPCTTAESCRVAPAPQPEIFGAPPSATFSGTGNSAPAAKVTPKAKPLTRAQKLAKALKACMRKPKKQRAGCESRARRQYGAKAKAKKPKKASKSTRGGKS